MSGNVTDSAFGFDLCRPSSFPFCIGSRRIVGLRVMWCDPVTSWIRMLVPRAGFLQIDLWRKRMFHTFLWWTLEGYILDLKCEVDGTSPLEVLYSS